MLLRRGDLSREPVCAAKDLRYSPSLLISMIANRANHPPIVLDTWPLSIPHANGSVEEESVEEVALTA